MTIRVLMFAQEYPPHIVGGLARVVHALSHKLAEQGCEVHVVTANHEGSPQHEMENGVHVHRVKNQTDWTPDFNTGIARLNIGLIQLAIKLHMKEPFDIVHAHDWLVADAAWAMKDGFGLPIVSTIHATEQGRMKGLHNDTQLYVNQVEWRLIYESKKVIVNSPSMVTDLWKQLQVPNSKINVIPNGIDADKFQCHEDPDELRRKYDVAHNEMVLLVGRAVYEKGIHILLDAVPRILKERPSTMFMIAGTGGYLEQLKAKAASMHLMHKVRFFGHANDKDLSELYKIASVSVAPSLYEPFGIVALEAMAAGVPLVTSNAGGLGYVNKHMSTGIQTQAENPQSLAAGILELLNNPDLAEELSETARSHVQEFYTWEAIALKTRQIYEEVLADHRKKSND